MLFSIKHNKVLPKRLQLMIFTKALYMHRSNYDMKITSFHIEPNMIIFDQGVKQNENLKTLKKYIKWNR